MQYKTIVELLNSDPTHHEVMVRGWVRSFRSNRFITLNDGSTIKTLQCVVDFENFDEELLKKVTVGAAIEVKGMLVESQGQGQTVEIQVSKLTVLGEANPEDVKLTIISPKTCICCARIFSEKWFLLYAFSGNYRKRCRGCG